VRVNYRGNRASADQIASHIGVTFFGVRGQIQSLGIVKVTDYRKNWTPEEEERLADLGQTYCPRRVAHMMHRSLASVTVKMKRMRILRRIKNGWFDKAEVCDILGVDHKWVQRRIDRGELEASHHHERRPSKEGSGSWHIWQESLAQFIRDHARELDGRSVDLQAIVWLLDLPKNGKKNREGVT
jgi:hypothetical protein